MWLCWTYDKDLLMFHRSEGCASTRFSQSQTFKSLTYFLDPSDPCIQTANSTRRGHRWTCRLSQCHRGGWGVRVGWMVFGGRGVVAKRKQLLLCTYLKLSLFLQRFHLGLIGDCCVALWDPLPLHFLHYHNRFPLPEAARGEHIWAHAVSKVRNLQGEEKRHRE